MLRSKRGGEDAMLAGMSTVPMDTTSRMLPPSGNMIAGNFASADRGQSQYLTATLNSFSVSKQMQNQADNRVTALLDTLGGIKVGETKGNVRTPAWIEMQLRRIMYVETQEESQQNLDDIKDDIEKRAKEANAPKDENGEPIENLPTEGVEAAPSPEPSVPSTEDVKSEIPQETSAPVDEAIAAYSAGPNIPVTATTDIKV